MAFNFQSSYEELNSADDDYKFYAALAMQVNARDVIDLGCGTGALARLLVANGCSVLGIDPDAEMLRVAAQNVTSGDVEWRLGYSDQAADRSADLFVMSGHVAQVFIAEAAWQQVLDDASRALRPGGVIAFESRNPDTSGWERWTRDQTLQVVGVDDDATEFWHETVQVDLPVVVYDTWTANVLTGERQRSTNTLAFRTASAVVRSLSEAGFQDITVFGDWDRSEVTRSSPELVFVAQTPAEPPA